MYRKLLFIIVITISLPAFSARDLYVVKSDLSEITYNTTDIDSITFDDSQIDDNYTISLHDGESVASFSVSELNKIYLGPYFDEDDINNNEFGTTYTFTYKSSSVSVYPTPAEGITVEQNGTNIVVRSELKGINYVLKSSMYRTGSFKLYSTHKSQLTLNGINLGSSNGSAINIQTGKRTFVVIADGTQNYITDSAVYPEKTEGSEDQKAAIFSEGELIFSGKGSLNVSSLAKHGIASDDYVSIYDGNIVVSNAAKDGLKSKQKFIMKGGSLNITALDDGLDCTEGYIKIYDGNINITSADKGLIASYDSADVVANFEVFDPSINTNITINSGTMSITTGVNASIDEQKAHGIQTSSDVIINSGIVNINANVVNKSDGINCNGIFVVNGGSITIEANDDCYPIPIFNAGTLSCDGAIYEP